MQIPARALTALVFAVCVFAQTSPLAPSGAGGAPPPALAAAAVPAPLTDKQKADLLRLRLQLSEMQREYLTALQTQERIERTHPPLQQQYRALVTEIRKQAGATDKDEWDESTLDWKPRAAAPASPVPTPLAAKPPPSK